MGSNREQCLQLLEGYGVGQKLHRLIRHFWDEATIVCRALGTTARPSRQVAELPKAAHCRQSFLTSWSTRLFENGIAFCGRRYMPRRLFAIFFKGPCLPTTRPRQHLRTCWSRDQHQEDAGNDMHAWQKPAPTPRRMRSRYTSASEWEARAVTCRECGKSMRASSLDRHLTDVHEIYQQAVVSEELLEDREPVLYQARENWARKYPCPYPRCKGIGVAD